MSSEKQQNLQDVFLNNVRKAKIPVTIFLVNGVKLQGIITWFDNFCVLLRRDAHSQLVYKHAISTVMPAQPVQLFEPSQGVEELWKLSRSHDRGQNHFCSVDDRLSHRSKFVLFFPGFRHSRYETGGGCRFGRSDWSWTRRIGNCECLANKAGNVVRSW